MECCRNSFHGCNDYSLLCVGISLGDLRYLAELLLGILVGICGNLKVEFVLFISIS